MCSINQRAATRAWIDFSRVLKKNPRLLVLGRRQFVEMPHCSLVRFPSIQATRRLSDGSTLFCFPHGGKDRRRHGVRNLALHSKYVRNLPVIAFGPYVVSRQSVDKLNRYSRLCARSSNTSLHNVMHSKLASNLLHIDKTASVTEAGIAGGDKKLTLPRQLSDDVVGNTIAKILLITVVAHVVKGQHRNRRPVRQWQNIAVRSPTPLTIARCRGNYLPDHERLHRAGDVLQTERPKLLENEFEPVAHMITHWSRNTDAAGWTFSLKSCRNIHRVAVEISPIGNHVAKIDADTKADGSVGRLVAIVDRNFLLHLHRTAHRPVDAVEHDEQGVAAGLDDPAAMFLDRWIDHFPAERPQSCEGSSVVQADQAGIAHHVGM